MAGHLVLLSDTDKLHPCTTRWPSRRPIPRCLRAAAGGGLPALAEVSLVIASARSADPSFPDFDLWPLAWIGMVPLFVVIARPLKARARLLLGWLWGLVFFYGTCWWLTYPMIHYAHISALVGVSASILPIALVALFPGLFSLMLSRLVFRFGLAAIFVAPLYGSRVNGLGTR